MLTILLSLAISASKPEYLTEYQTVQSMNGNTPAWIIDFDKFEKVLLAKPQNGQKIKITLPDYNSQYQEYEIEPEPLFALATKKKYPNKLFAFRGNLVGNKDECIGLVYCFQSLKAYFVNHYQTIEMDGELNKIVIRDLTKNADPVRRLLETNSSDLHNIIKENSHTKRTPKEIDIKTQPQLVDTSFQESMSDIKVIKLIPFPTQSFVTNYGSGLMTITNATVSKINIFSSLALSVSYLNRIYLPVLSLRFEVQLDLNMIVSRDYNDRKKYLIGSDRDISTDFNHINKILEYSYNFFEQKDIDLGIMISSSQAPAGKAFTGCYSPFSPSRSGAYVIGKFQEMGSD